MPSGATADTPSKATTGPTSDPSAPEVPASMAEAWHRAPLLGSALVAHITPPSEVEQLRRRVAELEQALASRRWGRRIAPSATPDAPTEPVEPSAPDADTPALWPEDEQRALADAFHRLWYDRRDRTWTDTHFLGAQLLKLPLDLWVYQELVWRIRPTVFVETGTFMGGSALYFASLFDLIGEGRVVSVDIEHAGPVPEHRGSTT